MPRPRHPLTARTPRPGTALLVVVPALALALALVAVVPTVLLVVVDLRSGPLGPVGSPSWPSPPWLPAVRDAVAGALLLALARVPAHRAQVSDAEQDVWRRFARALRCAAVGLGLQALVGAASTAGVLPSSRLLPLPLLLSAVVACALLYQGLIGWNRVRTVTADTSDWLNGASAVLVVVAVGELVVVGTGVGADAWPAWQVQGWLVRLGAAVVLLGAAATVVLMAPGRPDLRRALVLAAPAAVLAGTVGEAAAAGRSGTPAVLGWVVAGALLAGAARRDPEPVGSRPASTREVTAGSAVVMAAGVLVLVVDALASGSFTAATGCAAAAVLGGGARVWHLVRDLDQLAATRQQALTDELTGAANRGALTARLDASRPSGASLLVLDLDGFKRVNDVWGHAVGDALLRAVAQRLRAVLPPDALLARLGGDQFAILLPHRTGAGTALGAAAVEALAAPVEVAGHQLPVGVSVGVAHSAPPHAGVGADELLRRADAAMHLAKAAGGRRTRAYDEAVGAAALDRALLAEDLRAVLADPDGDEILVHYQPQLDVGSGDVVGVEALVRWQHPRLGRISPDDFLPLVEELGLMAVLTARVLGRAAAESELWSTGPGPAIRLAVNLSASCLARPELLPVVSTVLARHPGLAERLVLEVTETAIMADPDVALATMDRLCGLGVAFSIDDYGTGFASLAYLHDLPAVELKLDRSFTARLSGGGRTAAIVAGTVELAHQLGMRLIAEGVEDAETLALLAGLGCDETQGYFHARPMPAADLLTWLAAHRPTPVRAAPAATPSAAAPTPSAAAVR